MHLRPFAPDDFEQLYAIEESCFAPALRFDRRYMRSLVRRKTAAVWIAEEDGRMAGFVIVEWNRRRQGLQAHIQTLEVAPGHRGRGVGRELLARCVHSARVAGSVVIWLHVAEANEGAIRLYQRHGFLVVGRLEDYYPAGGPALVMALELALSTPGQES